MEKDKELGKSEDNMVETAKEKVKLEDKIVDIFKIMLGYNWHEMGNKKKF